MRKKVCMVLMFVLGYHLGFAMTDAEVRTKLQAIRGSKIEEVRANYNALEDTRDFIVNNMAGSGILDEFVRVAGLLAIVDPSGHVGEIVYPVWLKDKKAFEDSLKKLPADQADRLLHFIRVFIKVQDSGNS